MLNNPQKFLKSLPNKPGIYQMYNARGKILYVGKAKDLKKRLRSYFYSVKNPKTIAFMTQVVDIKIIITANENDALLLESNLIKTLKPHYNILFKDDKSFPYLFLSQHDFPRLSSYRGSTKKLKGRYFGPFPSIKAVNFTLKLLQKIFHLRTCSDGFLRNRTRSCMLHQIKLCDGPCVGLIDKKTYAGQIKLVEQFLRGESDCIVNKLTKLMGVAAEELDYEQAATYRNQITSIRKVQAKQAITNSQGSYDVVALVVNDDAICIDVLFVRNGLLLGNKSYFPVGRNFDLSSDEILTTFLMQHYLQSDVDIVPDKILVNVKLKNRLEYASILSKKFGRKIIISDRVQKERKLLITMAEANAQNSLKTRYTTSENYLDGLLEFKKIFGLTVLPRRIECFDVSHMMGEAQIAACVVFDEDGSSKGEYRRVNLKNVDAGDDYGALREVLLRRYKEQKNLPDVIMIDGGKGQLNVAVQALKELQIQNVLLISIAKGPKRKPGLEEIYIVGKKYPLVLPPQSHALHFIQQVRDEAHRFAIGGHRKKMRKTRNQSSLDNIHRVGKSKQVALLKYFGGLTELKSAGIDDLTGVKGIGRNLATRIYEYLHAK